MNKNMSKVLGYAVFRHGHPVSIERTLSAAKQWVDAEIVPVCAAPEVERYKQMETALKVIQTWASVEGGLWPPHVYELCERSLK